MSQHAKMKPGSEEVLKIIEDVASKLAKKKEEPGVQGLGFVATVQGFGVPGFRALAGMVWDVWR